MMLALSLVALVGAPVIAGLWGWHVYTGKPWLEPRGAWAFLARLSIGLTAGMGAFNSWFSMCDQIKAIIEGSPR